MKAAEKKKLYDLLNAMREGDLTGPQMQELESLILHYPDACQAYVDYVLIWSDLRNFQSSTPVSSIPVLAAQCDGPLSGQTTQTILTILADNEKSAQPLPNPAEPDNNNPIHPAYRRNPLGRKEIIHSALRIAAVLLFCLAIIALDRWVMRESAIQPRRVVARLEEQMGADWDRSLRIPRENGAMVQDRYRLTGGVITVGFNDGARVVIEGPAEWILNSEDNLFLQNGRVFATVSPRATGFSVNTDNAKIIDLGTEFGVMVDPGGSTELHMFKGQAQLITGKTGAGKISRIFNGGQAGRILADNGSMVKIDLQEKMFTRQIHPALALAWQGKATLNLADVIGGGNGLGTGKSDWAIDPVTGNTGPKIRYYSPDTLDPTTGEQLSGRGTVQNSRFSTVPANPFIDCVVVPRGSGPVTLSTLGHQFTQCPPCSGEYHQQITNSNPLGTTLPLGGVKYGSPEQPGFYMHSSWGLTFDLEAIRQAFPGVYPHKFHTLFGLIDGPQPLTNRIVLTVLVDGQIRFTQSGNLTGAHPVEVALNPQDRFLTLFINDGGDGTNDDRCVFGDPGLDLKMRGQP